MNKEAWISAITAFLISAGGAIGVVLVGDTPTVWQVLAAIVLGLVTAAKDVRSLFKLPPVDKVGVWLLCGLLGFTLLGCAVEKRLETGGPYAATATQAAQAELFVLDSSFDLAYASLDAAFKYERDNRALLWKLSPDIKRALDKLRKEAGTVRDDYALARTVYLQNPTPAGLDELRTALSKLQQANQSALSVVQTKGNQ